MSGFVVRIGHFWHLNVCFGMRPFVLIKSLQVTGNLSELSVFQGPLAASTVGDLVGRQSEQIKQIASHYADKVMGYYVARSMLEQSH